MKKILALVMSLAICFCCSLTLFAAGTPEANYNGQTNRADVNVSINGEVTHVYLVDIEFTAGTFTYLTGSKWNPETYRYEPISTPEWSGDGKVKIINHSDLSVNYSVTSENVTNAYGPLQIEVAGGTGTIEKCSVGDVKGSHNAEITYGVSGVPTQSELTNVKLGEIVVKITK